MKKHLHYIPIIIGVFLLATFYFLEAQNKLEVNNFVYFLIYLLLGLGFPYCLFIESEKFRKKGKYKTVYRLTFGAGFICSMFLLEALNTLFLKS